MDNFEKNISQQLQNDQLSFTPDRGIQNRLMYHMELKSANSAVRKNQLLPSLSALFAAKFLAWKVGVAALFLISFMGYKQFKYDASFSPVVDTAQIIQSIDTTNFMLEDSVSIN